MRRLPRDRRPRAHLVTEAQQSLSQDISNRERRYLIMMAIRVACFLAAVLLFVRGAGWFTLIPAVGAVGIPYIAVVFANGGREPARSTDLVDFHPQMRQRESHSLPPATARSHVVGHVAYEQESAQGPADGQSPRHAGQSPETGQNPPPPDRGDEPGRNPPS